MHSYDLEFYNGNNNNYNKILSLLDVYKYNY